MRTYRKKSFLIGGIIIHDIEIWEEHNHATVYSNKRCIFDGYKCEAETVIKDEIERIKQAAMIVGLSFQTA